MKKILITGVKSGIGKYLHENLGGYGVTRENREMVISSSKQFDVIIHCAYNAMRDVDSENLYSYVSDNILLTERLLAIPHKKFIFFSTVDVYPRSEDTHREDEIISMQEMKGTYATTKLISKSLIRNRAKNFLIMRPTGLLGTYAKKGSLMKMISDKAPVITLTGDSQINCIMYADVLAFLQVAIKKDLKGIYNLASKGNITPKEVAVLTKKNISYGTFEYAVGKYDVSKAIRASTAFNKSSAQVIRAYITQHKSL